MPDLLDELTQPPPVKWRERDMLDLLRDRYTKIRPGTDADRWVRAEHAPMPWLERRYDSGLAHSIADYIALDTYGQSDVIGHEVKVTRSDWLAELRRPDKSARWREYCTHWHLVIPDLSIVRDDLPEGWGLMCIDKTGRLKVKRRAPLNENRKSMPPPLVAALGRAIAKTRAREIDQLGRTS